MKRAALALACVLAISATSMTAMAHGHSGYRRARAVAPTYSICNVEGCTTAGVHEHDGSYYCGHAGDYSCSTNHGYNGYNGYRGRGHHH